MRLLITGGTGFIAHHFITKLREEGRQLHLLDLYPPDFELSDGVVFFQGDVRDSGAVRRAMEGCDAVLHLAAAHHDFGLSREVYFSVNEAGTRVVCQAMEALGIQRLCFLSSVAVYGSQGAHTEAEEPAPVHLYGQSKLAAEQVIESWCRAAPQRSCLIIRPAVVFGPGNFANMFKLIRQIDRRLFVSVGRGDNRKSMAYVTNLVAATLHLWSRCNSEISVYNYVDKPDLSSREIVDIIYRALGRTPPRLSIPLGVALLLARPFDALAAILQKPLAISSERVVKLAGVTSVFDASAVRGAGFIPEVTLPEGIRRMVDWYRVTTSHRSVEARLPPITVQIWE